MWGRTTTTDCISKSTTATASNHFYAHCSRICVTTGQTVSAGEKVAEVGSTGNSTGPHLHLELKYAGTHLDPAYYIDYKQAV